MTDPREVHFSSLVIDGHADTAQRFVDEGWSFTDPIGDGMLSLDAARAGGLNAEFFAIWAEPREWQGRYAYRTLQLIDGVLEQVRKHPDVLALGLRADDIEAAHAAGKFCALMGIEGGHSIENDLGLLRTFYRLGIRYMTLTWSNTNEWADSSGDLNNPNVSHHGGLTDFGRDVVREMNRLGMMVDVSHVADTTFWDVLRTTRAPVLVSHSSARALASHPRNLTDEQLQAVATSNGIVMVNFYPSFLSDDWLHDWSATSAERDTLYEQAAQPYRDRNEPVPYSVSMTVDREFYTQTFSKHTLLPDIETLIDHFDHVARVAGIDHIGIGSDFDGFSMGPRGLETAAQLPAITERLMARGYTSEQMHKLLGGNFLRVMRAVEIEAESE
jgi:membrane dipeptidase